MIPLMPILMDCPHCRRSTHVPTNSATQAVRCSACGQKFTVPTGTADLTVEWGPVGAGRTVALRPGHVTTFGREKQNNVVLPGALVSRRHASLEWIESEWRLTDLGSGNGTYVDGLRTREVVLTHGCHIVIGEFGLRFSLVQSGPSELDTTLDAMALDESSSRRKAIPDIPADQQSPIAVQSDTTVAELPLIPSADDEPQVDAPGPPFLQQWPVFIALTVVVVFVAALLVLKLKLG